jgi:hypothetical protein
VAGIWKDAQNLKTELYRSVIMQQEYSTPVLDIFRIYHFNYQEKDYRTTKRELQKMLPDRVSGAARKAKGARTTTEV